MILSLQAFAPAALLLLGGLWLLARPGATVFVCVQALAFGALMHMVQLAATTLTVPVYHPLPDVALSLRFDALSTFFAAVALGAGLLVSLPRLGERRPLPYGWLALAQFGAVGGILAGELPGMAVGWGFAVASLMLMVVMPEPPSRLLTRPRVAVTRSLVLQLTAAGLLLAGTVGIELLAGTTGYDAIPVGAVTSRTGLLLAASPLLALAGMAGLVRACRRPATAAAALCSVILPLAIYVLARTLDLSEGRSLPVPARSALVLGGTAGSTLFALYALWSPDLGAAVARLLGALGMLLVAAFGVGGAGGLVALLVGFLALEVSAASGLGLIDAGGGRLPGGGSLPPRLVGMLGLVPLVALAGAPLALGLDSRLVLVRRLLDEGAVGYVLAVPLALALVILAVSAVAAGRFGGGRVDGPRATAGLLIAAVAPVALEGSAPWWMGRVTTLAAEAAHAPLADVRSTALASVPSGLVAVVLLLATLAVVAGAGASPRWFSAEDGLRLAPDLLPPRIAVAPGIAARAMLRRARSSCRTVAAAAGAHRRAAVATGWTVAVVGVLLAVR